MGCHWGGHGGGVGWCQGSLVLSFASPPLQNALMLSCSKGFVDIVPLLRQCPYINVNQEDKDGNTALMIAAQAGRHRAWHTADPSGAPSQPRSPLGFPSDSLRRSCPRCSSLALTSPSGLTAPPQQFPVVNCSTSNAASLWLLRTHHHRQLPPQLLPHAGGGQEGPAGADGADEGCGAGAAGLRRCPAPGW